MEMTDLPLRAPARPAAEPAVAVASGTRVVVLVEGASDRNALEALSRRTGHDLAGEGVAVVAMGGSKNVRRYLELYGPHRLGVRVAGLCDAAEEGDVRRGLERAGLGSAPTRADLERLGFHVCVADLEDELIRALGADAVERVVAAQDELAAFRTFQHQPAWQGRSREAQLRRFLGTHSGRKVQSAPLLVEALDLARIPGPLQRLLAQL